MCTTILSFISGILVTIISVFIRKISLAPKIVITKHDNISINNLKGIFKNIDTIDTYSKDEESFDSDLISFLKSKNYKNITQPILRYIICKEKQIEILPQNANAIEIFNQFYENDEFKKIVEKYIIYSGNILKYFTFTNSGQTDAREIKFFVDTNKNKFSKISYQYKIFKKDSNFNLLILDLNLPLTIDKTISYYLIKRKKMKKNENYILTIEYINNFNHKKQIYLVKKIINTKIKDEFIIGSNY